MIRRVRTLFAAAAIVVAAVPGVSALGAAPAVAASTTEPAATRTGAGNTATAGPAGPTGDTTLPVSGVPLLSASGCTTPDDVPLRIVHDLTTVAVPTGWFEECRLPNGDMLLRNRTQVVWETDVSVSPALVTQLVIRDSAPEYTRFHTTYQAVHQEYGALIAPGESLQVAASVPAVRLFLEQRGTFLWAAGRQLTDSVAMSAGASAGGLATTRSLLDPTSPLGAAYAACMTSAMIVGQAYADATGVFEIARMPGLYRSAVRKATCATPWRAARLEAAAHGVTVPRLAATVPSGPVSDLATAQSFLNVAARMRAQIG